MNTTSSLPQSPPGIIHPQDDTTCPRCNGLGELVDFDWDVYCQEYYCPDCNGTGELA